MPSAQARAAAANAVRAFLGEIASVYLGKVFDHRRDPWSKMIWDTILEKFDHRCAYCNTPSTNFTKGVSMTQEHLVEVNQFQCGLHHPGNTVPACSECNGSRDKSPEGSRLTWQEHLTNVGRRKGYNAATVEKRRQAIQKFIDSSGYPILTKQEHDYLLKTSRELYQEVAAKCSAGRRGFIAIHGAAAVRISAKPQARRYKPEIKSAGLIQKQSTST